MKTRLRWFALHGFLRLVARRAAAAGDLQARLVADPDVRRDPTGLYADIRSRGPVVRSRMAAITVDHAVVHDTQRMQVVGPSAPFDRLQWAG